MKFTERGEVVLTVSATGRRRRPSCTFAVRDTGIGLTAEAIGRLFQKFTQADASHDAQVRRHGPRARDQQAARRADGRHDVGRERRPGRGSTFHVHDRAPVADAARAGPARVHRRAAARSQGRRVLVVDDNATNRRVLELQTAKWGMVPARHRVARRGAALVRDGGRAFDLAILDMHMPEMDGLDAGAQRSARVAPALPLVLFSSLGPQGGRRYRRACSAPISPSRCGRSQLFDTLVTLLAQDDAPRRSPRRRRPELDASMAQRHPLRILLAEDNVVNQKLALRLLQQMGYRADLASQRHRGDRVGRAPALRRRADGRADARDGRSRGDAQDHARVAPTASGRASSR